MNDDMKQCPAECEIGIIILKYNLIFSVSCHLISPTTNVRTTARTHYDYHRHRLVQYTYTVIYDTCGVHL